MTGVGVGARVRIEGEKTVYVVVRVDRERYVADLLPVEGKRLIESNVPLTSLHPTENGPFRIGHSK